ncbi:hypothetical protein F4677DRAFT_432028 [Hypoxylon crocopeplum]|nr:hypothetical protein F4677DRAFT_432028 [Hypoxylon crocopeplum]
MVETPRYIPGGFLSNVGASLPSPAPSTASSRAAARLPHPRSKPLARGSRKEDYARNYVSDRLMHISRRFVKKHGIPDAADEVTGYKTMDEVCKDLEEVVDVLWFSGTPSLQIPYLLNIALAFNTYLPSFPPSPLPTFALLKKLDHCFASLIVGRDIKSGNPLPGFQGSGRGLTSTDMVRCKSLADETRMLVAMVMSDEPDVENFADADDDDDTAFPTRKNVGVSLSTGFIQTPVPNSSNTTTGTSTPITEINQEEFIDFDDESDTSDAAESDHAATKRKYDVADFDNKSHEDKRVKVEEVPTPKFTDAAPGHRSPIPMVDGPGQVRPGEKFQWMLDDDDLFDDDTPDDVNSSAAAPTPDNTNTTTDTAAPTTVQMASDTEREMGEPNDDLDEEEEELQLNVGKVYERTLVQLGKSLGESITDEY